MRPSWGRVVLQHETRRCEWKFEMMTLNDDDVNGQTTLGILRHLRHSTSIVLHTYIYNYSVRILLALRQADGNTYIPIPVLLTILVTPPIPTNKPAPNSHTATQPNNRTSLFSPFLHLPPSLLENEDECAFQDATYVCVDVCGP